MADTEVPVFEDDPQLVDQAIARLKKSFKTGKTRSYAYRTTQLKQLMKGMKIMAKELSAAVT